tara:strand:- start:1718 stop:1945 length:228 start_codon:yes stop_codon:yes gene_type:complete
MVTKRKRTTYHSTINIGFANFGEQKRVQENKPKKKKSKGYKKGKKLRGTKTGTFGNFNRLTNNLASSTFGGSTFK